MKIPGIVARLLGAARLRFESTKGRKMIAGLRYNVCFFGLLTFAMSVRTK